jgi:hypothetical protein
MRLVSFRSVIISGGQYDLSNRFLGPVFLPDLWEKARDPIFGELVHRLARAASATEQGLTFPALEIDQLVANLYGVPELAAV